MSMSDTSPPFVSVIVPMRNEERHIERCLLSIAEQDYPHDRFEVIVVDGASTDASRTIVESMASTLPSLRVIDNRGKHTSRGLNIGLAYARGDVIVRIDAHASVVSNFLSESVAALERSKADAVGGPIETLGEGPAGAAIAVAVSSPFGVGTAVYRRDVFDRIGPFAEIDGGEDDDFHLRLIDSGGRILLTPAIRSTYYSRRSLLDLARQYFGYGQAKLVVLMRHPRRTRLRQLAPAGLVVALAGSFIAAMFGGAMVLPLAAVIGAYVTASLTASLLLAQKHGWRHLVRLPLAFAIMHLSYGVGFLSGLARRTAGQQVAVPREAEAP
jgi:succinoglycan biosynthesis protein ExoA